MDREKYMSLALELARESLNLITFEMLIFSP